MHAFDVLREIDAGETDRPKPRRRAPREAVPGFVAEQGVDPLAVDVGGPPRPERVVDGQLQKNIPHRRGIEDVGVEQNRELRQRTP